MVFIIERPLEKNVNSSLGTVRRCDMKRGHATRLLVKEERGRHGWLQTSLASGRSISSPFLPPLPSPLIPLHRPEPMNGHWKPCACLMPKHLLALETIYSPWQRPPLSSCEYSVTLPRGGISY